MGIDNSSAAGTHAAKAARSATARPAIERSKRHQPNVLLDLLGDRLASEQTGTRLYDALLVKLPAAPPHPGRPTRDLLERIRDEETAHFILVSEAIDALGGDPTATPASADVIGVAGSAWVQVLTDPRTTWLDSLQVMLAAELVDNDAWRALLDLAEGLGQRQLAASFRWALTGEEQHLLEVRGWLVAAINAEAGIAPRLSDATRIWLP